MIRRTSLDAVVAALRDTPVVLIHGPRQSGKSTLAREAADQVGGFRHINLDDLNPRTLALEDPAFFVQSLGGPTLIDEVQRAPGIFLSMKAAVDRDRKPGQFLLTGSSNVLALPKLADSLAGRMEIIDLLPFSQAEMEERPSTFLEQVFSEEPLHFPVQTSEDVATRIARGGFPEASVRTASRRNAWFEAYVRTLLDRDVRDLANIEGLTQLPRLLRLLASRAGSTLNVSSLARDTGIPNTSLHRYLDLLKAVFLIHHVPVWSDNRGARLTKTPKAYLVDTGLLCFLENLDERSLRQDPDRMKPVLDNFVALELLKLSATHDRSPVLHHLRTVKQLEVDFVLEARGGDVVGIEVHPFPSIRPELANGLRFLKELAGDQFRRGVILYLGEETVPLARDIWAVPISALWS